jgi:hypothetical protein
MKGKMQLRSCGKSRRDIGLIFKNSVENDYQLEGVSVCLRTKNQVKMTKVPVGNFPAGT